MSNQEDKFDFSDFEELGSRIQKTIDDATAEVLKQADNVKEEALKQVDKAKEEAARQMDKAREETSKQFDRAKDSMGKTFDRFKSQQDGRAYINVGHGRKVVSGKLKKNPGMYSGPAEIAVGVAGLGLFGGAGLGLGVTTFVGTMTAGLAITSAAICVPFAIISAVLLGKGILNSKRARRIKQYSGIWTGKPYIMIEDIRNKVGWDRKRILKDIRFLIQRELIIGAELDEGETCLMLTEESKQQYRSVMESRKIREQEAARTKELEAAMENASPEQREVYRIKREGQQYLKQLADSRVQITDSQVREKIAHMEVLAARIFVAATEHPECISQTDKLFKYYFPSVIKLLNTYRDLEKQPYQGENIQKTRKEIEESLETMNRALEKLFDEMFQNVAMDISSDIQVLEVMLRQDGLTEDGMHASGKDAMFTL